MSLLLLFNDQVAPTPGNTSTTASLETTPGVFVNISSRLMGGETTRGKQRELDRYDAGQLTVAFENSDRLLDPEYAAGAYYGSLLPNKRLPVTTTYNGITYPIIVGYVDRIRQVYTSPNTCQAVFEATDAFKPLSRAPLATSAYAQEVKADSPTHWWRLGEPASTTTVYDSVGTAHGAVTGSPAFGETGLVDREADTAVRITNRDNRFLIPARSMPTGTAMTLELWVRRDTVKAFHVFDHVNIAGVPVYLSVQMTGLGSALYVDVGSAGVSVANATGGTNLAALTRYHIAVVLQVGQPVAFYVDGVLDSTVAVTGTIAALPSAADWFVAENSALAGTGEQPDCTIDEITIYDTALSAARVAAHNTAGRTPWTGDLPGARATRVLDAAGWPTVARNLDTGTTTLQGATLAGMSALEHLQKVAESDLGLLYITRDGVVRLEARANLINQTSVATITDTQGSVPAITGDEPYITDDLVRNVVTVSRSDGVAQTARDASSITLNGPVGYTRDGLYNDSDDLSLHIAEYVVAEFKDAKQRVDQVTVAPRGNAATLFPIALGLELSDWVTVKQKPQDVGAETSRVTVVEGIAHTFGPKSWETTFNLSPAPGGGGTTGYWALGVAGHSELGQTTTLYL